MKKIHSGRRRSSRCAGAAGAGRAAAHRRQLRRRERQRAEEGLLRAVREDGHQGRGGRIQRRAGQDQGDGRDQEGHLGRRRGRVARRRRAAATKACSRSSTTARSATRPTSCRRAVTDCGIGIFVWSTVMAYNGDKLKTAPDDLGRFLGHEEVPRQARHAQGRALQPRIRADGRRREAGRRLQGAGHQGRRRPRVQEARASSSPTSSGGKPARSRRSSSSPATS